MKMEYSNVRFPGGLKRDTQKIADLERRNFSDMIRIFVEEGVERWIKYKKKRLEKSALKEANQVFKGR